MNFGSDNMVGASAPVFEALRAVNQGAMHAYGADDVTLAVEKRLAGIFERDVKVFLVGTGTAANALSLAACVSPWGMAVCHEEAHVQTDECGAPEFFMHGAKLSLLPGESGKLSADKLDAYLSNIIPSSRQMPPQAVTISQVTEAGTVYSTSEITAIAKASHDHGTNLHMDGARFANALVSLGCSPAEMTWKSGVDILSFGGSKNGCLAAEAIVVFKDELAKDMEYLRKRSGHTWSKSRFLAAQFEGYLADDHWLANARHANAMAALLAEGLKGLPGVRVPWAVQANQLFPIISKRVDDMLQAAGGIYYPWSTGSLPAGEVIGADEVMIRLVTSFESRQDDVENFIKVIRSAAA